MFQVSNLIGSGVCSKLHKTIARIRPLAEASCELNTSVIVLLILFMVEIIICLITHMSGVNYLNKEIVVWEHWFTSCLCSPEYLSTTCPDRWLGRIRLERFMTMYVSVVYFAVKWPLPDILLEVVPPITHCTSATVLVLLKKGQQLWTTIVF